MVEKLVLPNIKGLNIITVLSGTITTLNVFKKKASVQYDGTLYQTYGIDPDAEVGFLYNCENELPSPQNAFKANDKVYLINYEDPTDKQIYTKIVGHLEKNRTPMCGRDYLLISLWFAGITRVTLIKASTGQVVVPQDYDNTLSFVFPVVSTNAEYISFLSTYFQDFDPSVYGSLTTRVEVGTYGTKIATQTFTLNYQEPFFFDYNSWPDFPYLESLIPPNQIGITFQGVPNVTHVEVEYPQLGGEDSWQISDYGSMPGGAIQKVISDNGQFVWQRSGRSADTAVTTLINGNQWVMSGESVRAVDLTATYNHPFLGGSYFYSDSFANVKVISISASMVYRYSNITDFNLTVSDGPMTFTIKSPGANNYVLSGGINLLSAETPRGGGWNTDPNFAYWRDHTYEDTQYSFSPQISTIQYGKDGMYYLFSTGITKAYKQIIRHQNIGYDIFKWGDFHYPPGFYYGNGVGMPPYSYGYEWYYIEFPVFSVTDDDSYQSPVAATYADFNVNSADDVTADTFFQHRTPTVEQGIQSAVNSLKAITSTTAYSFSLAVKIRKQG